MPSTPGARCTASALPQFPLRRIASRILLMATAAFDDGLCGCRYVIAVAGTVNHWCLRAGYRAEVLCLRDGGLSCRIPHGPGSKSQTVAAWTFQASVESRRYRTRVRFTVRFGFGDKGNPSQTAACSSSLTPSSRQVAAAAIEAAPTPRATDVTVTTGWTLQIGRGDCGHIL